MTDATVAQRSLDDPRDELIAVQLELETARGARARELLTAEKELLDDHATHFYGPLESLREHLDGELRWRRGFIDSVAQRHFFWQDDQGCEDPLPDSVLRDALGHPSLSLCRSLSSKRLPKRLPRTLDRLDLYQAVVTRRLLAAPSLRELHVMELVASAPLRHEQLRVLGLKPNQPALAALAEAELPSLELVSLAAAQHADAAQLAEALSRLPARKVTLEVAGKASSQRPGWTDSDFAELAPVADRIIGLSLSPPFVSAQMPLPSLRRLSVQALSPTGWRVDAFDFDALPPARELLLHVRSHQIDHGALASAFARSDFARQLRSLHLEAFTPLDLAGRAPLDQLEELSIMPMEARRAASLSDPFFQVGSLPSLRTLTLRMPQQLPGLAASPVAASVETLRFTFCGDESAQAFLDIRDRLTALRTLVVCGVRSLSVEMRGELVEIGCDVVFADELWEHKGWLAGAASAPGFAGFF